MLAWLTRVSITPGVHAESGSPPTLTQLVVFVRACGVHVPATPVGSGTRAGSLGTAVGVGTAGGNLAATEHQQR